MTMDGTPTSQERQAAADSAPKPRNWVPPTIFLIVIVVPVLILIFSNTESVPVAFAWAEVTAPRWLILAVTFVAGALVTRLVAWVWRTMRRRQKSAA
jgi:uncharacterized integral membrane protein